LPFLTIPVLCLFSMMLVLFLVKVPKRQSRQQQTDPSFPQFIRLIKDIFRKKGRWLYAIFAIGGICMFVIFAALFYLSDTLEDTHHIKGIVKGCLLAIPLAVLCLASFIAGKTIGKNKKLMKWVIFIGIVVVSGSLVSCGRVHSLAALIAWFSLAGLGIGVSLPCLDALITEGIEKEERGTITSIYSSTRFIGVAVGPPAASLLVTYSQEVLFYVLSGSCLVAAVLSFFAITPQNNTQAEY
jgi:ACDE family multidrug resistance protein